MNYIKLGENIRKERKKQNLTIEDLAYKADITPNYLGKIERAQSKPSLESVIKISNALEITTDVILAHEFNIVSNKILNDIDRKVALLSNTQKDNVELINLIIDFFLKKENKK